ncbi:MAG TPA: universal stress protein [Thermodesulfovibrionales bacterium]|nr:universal stress protein [Thermodesulfovibrionales bacterium]
MKILHATDGSEYSEGAARFLTRFHFSEKDEIVILHVVSDIPYADDAHAQLRHVIKRVAPKILNAAQKILSRAQARTNPMEEEGAPDATILRVATDTSADIIVMGARGLKGIQAFLLGSITRSVAINSPLPVLVTKPSPRETPEKMKVLFATDGSPSSRATATLLTSLPFPMDTELTIMNVAWSTAMEIPERYVMEVDDRFKEDVARARTVEIRESEKIIASTKTSLEGRFSHIAALSRGGDPALEILNYAETMKPDLIALGSRGMKGIKGMLGSVSRRILGHAQCPVLIGKAEHP